MATPTTSARWDARRPSTRTPPSTSAKQRCSRTLLACGTAASFPVSRKGASLTSTMATVEEGLKSQVRNIETKYGRPISSWADLIRASGKTKHNEVVALLKSKYGMTHGSAHRVALIARESMDGRSELANVDPGADPADRLYAGKKSAVRPIHNRLIAGIQSFGDDIEI